MIAILSFARRRPLATFFVLAFALAALPGRPPGATGPYRVGRVACDWEYVSRDDNYNHREGVILHPIP